MPQPQPPTDPRDQQQDVSYMVMPNLARKTIVDPQEGSAQQAETAVSQPVTKSINKKWFYIGGLAVLIVILGIIFFMMKKDTPAGNDQPITQTKLPKVWLSQYFGAETCADTSVCGDAA